MLISINSNLLNLAMPGLAADLRPSSTELVWISDSYVFLVAGLLLPMGLLADRFGRRRMLLIGAALFGLASVGAALATSPVALIGFRALAGCGGAMLAPSTISLIRSMFFHPGQRAVALGIWTASFALGGMVGPLIGGVLIESLSWRAVFVVTPPAMVALLVLGPKVLPEYRSDTPRPFDVRGALMAIAGVLGTVYAIKQLAAQASPLGPCTAGVVGVVLLVAFVRRQARVADPVLDLSLFRSRSFTVPQLGNALAFAVLYGIQLLTGQFLQAVFAMAPLEAGLWTIPGAVAYAIGGLLAPRLGARLGTGRLLAAGLAVSALGFGLLALADVGTGLPAFVTGGVISALGLAPVYQATTEAAVTAVPTDRAGVAGATLETITNLGGALGIAFFGTLAGAIYRRGTQNAGVDTQTIGDALNQAATLAPSRAEPLIRAAQDAFVDGFRLVAVTGAVLLLIASVSTAKLLRPQESLPADGRP
jgi:DHA2 family multidrug resistance protein-like MFS transporter